MSSSRDHVTCTGTPAACEISTASIIKSCSALCPNPPPRYVRSLRHYLSFFPVQKTNLGSSAAVSPAPWSLVSLQHEVVHTCGHGRRNRLDPHNAVLAPLSSRLAPTVVQKSACGKSAPDNR